MYKSWIDQSRDSEAYIHGVQKFIEFAFQNISQDASILCPCCVCANRFWHNKDEIKKKVQDKEEVPSEVLFLSFGPFKVANRYKGYIINDFRFHTTTCERKRITQNSGVSITARTRSFASVKVNNPVSGDVTYYGIIQDIIDINYYGKFNVMLFKCDWANIHAKGKGIKKDDLGFTLVNFKHLISNGNRVSDEPFILACQAEQVFYVREPMGSNWCVIVKNKPRDIFDLIDNNVDDLEFSGGTDEAVASYMDHNNDNITWTRDDMDMIVIDTSLLSSNETTTNVEEGLDF